MDKKTKENNILKTNFKLSEVIIIVLITIVLGIVIGYSVTNKVSKDTKKITTDKNLKEFIDTYNDVVENYYEEVDKNKLISSAINGMLSELDDPYSMYMDENTTEDFNDRLYGNYSGIGAEISTNENNEVYIYNLFENSPAKKVGLKPGDIITKVNDESVEGKTTSYISNAIKGIEGSEVNVTILRDNEEKTYKVTRGNITINSVLYEVLEKNNQKVGLININIFAANTYNQFKSAIEELENQGVNKIIIDVRYNSGGYLDSVTDIMKLFLEKGKTIYQLDEKNKKTKVKDDTKEKRDLDVIVLINEYSASASEILAASFQESYGAKIVGVNSYGKGTVQQTKELNTGGMLKYTTQKWLTPKGIWINDIGVTPDEKIEQSEEYYTDATNEKDTQLQKALEILTK